MDSKILWIRAAPSWPTEAVVATSGEVDRRLESGDERFSFCGEEGRYQVVCRVGFEDLTGIRLEEGYWYPVELRFLDI